MPEAVSLDAGSAATRSVATTYVQPDAVGSHAGLIVRPVGPGRAVDDFLGRYRSSQRSKGPTVILPASGMATGGRVVHHLNAFAPDRRNTILFAGYQAGGTRGAKILAGDPFIRIHGEDVPVRAEVARVGSLSAHADAGEILDWLKGFASDGVPRTAFITHGEPAAADALRLRIETELTWACHVPDRLETASLD